MFAFLPCLVLASHQPHEQLFRLDTTKGLRTEYGITMGATVYRGRPAVELIEEFDPVNGSYAVLPDVDFRDGTIDVDVAATLTENAGGSRGFVGIAFRGAEDMHRYENFYLRMTNGRSPDPDQRSHAIQYCSVPEYTWDYLRRVRPGKYEAYTDLELGAWTHIKIDVHGSEAKFFVGKSAIPALVVHGLLGGETHGKIALWVHAHTHAFFSNLKIRTA